MGSAVRARSAASGGLRDLPSQTLETRAHRGVEDRVAHAQDETADDLRIHPAAQLDAPAGVLADLLGHLLRHRRVELHRARDLDAPAPEPLPPATLEKSSSRSASSTSRRWSAPSSALRVTFSAASTVSSATSERSSRSARRVASSISRAARALPSAAISRARSRAS